MCLKLHQQKVTNIAITRVLSISAGHSDGPCGSPGVELLFLSAYSPNLNLIERLSSRLIPATRTSPFKRHSSGWMRRTGKGRSF